jgi:hypothetical protein
VERAVCSGSDRQKRRPSRSDFFVYSP